MEKTDLIKQDRNYYTAKVKAELITVNPSIYVSIQGKGDPSSPDFISKISALYAVAYKLKFLYKAKKKDFSVPKLEGLWWYDENQYKNLSPTEAPNRVPRREWQYRLLIRLPDYVVKQDIDKVKKEVYAKKESDEITKVEAFKLTEGKSVQILHKGSYDKEPETLEQMHIFIKENNFARNGLHHEIYLSDFRKTKPEKLKTILRQPVK